MAPPSAYCGLCGDAAIMTCFGCGEIGYCTVECLDANERAHKTLCAQVATFRDPPAPNMRRGILLPEDQKEPRFVWISIEVQEPAPGEEFDDSDDEAEISDEHNIPIYDPTPGTDVARVDEILNAGTTSRACIAASQVVVGSIGDGLHLDHTIWAAHRDAFLIDGSKVNKCVEYLTHGRSMRNWGGPILLHGQTKVVESCHCADLGVTDLTIGVEGLVKLTAEYGVLPKLTAVKVNSMPPYFEEVRVPVQHPVFAVGAKPSLSKTLGIPIKTHLYGGSNILSHINSGNKRPCVPAAYLHLILNANKAAGTTSSDIGTIPQGWIDNTRSILVAPFDPKCLHLSAKTIKAMCIFGCLQREAISAANTGPEAVARYIKKNLTQEKAVQMIVKMGQHKTVWDVDFASKFEQLSMEDL